MAVSPDPFTLFISMGPSRSLGELAKQTKLPIRSLSDMAHKEQWMERCDKIDARARDAFMDDAAQTVAAITKIQLQIAAELQIKALQAFRELPLTRVQDALTAMKLAVDMQRRALYMDERGETAEEKVANLILEKMKAVEAIETKPFEYSPTIELPVDPTVDPLSLTAPLKDLAHGEEP